MGSSSGGSSGGGSSNSSSSGTYYSPGSNMNGTGKGYTGVSSGTSTTSSGMDSGRSYSTNTPSTGTYYSPGSNMNGSGTGYTGVSNGYARSPASTSSTIKSSTTNSTPSTPGSSGSSNTNSTSDTVTKKEPDFFETLKTTRNLPSWANHATYSNVSAPSYMTNIGGGTASGSMPSVGAYDSSKLASIGNIYDKLAPIDKIISGGSGEPLRK